MVKKILEFTKGENQSRIFLAQTSLALSVVLFFIKYWSFHITQSQALLSDAMETVVNIVVAGMSLWAIYWAAQPADQGHPYGHGKAEYLSAAFEGGLIFAAALFIIASATTSFFQPRTLTQLNLGMSISLGAAVINGLLGWLLIHRGRQLNSAAIIASGHHLISDLLTTIGVLVGLLLVGWTHLNWIDGVLAIGVSIHLLLTGLKLVRGALGNLLDATNREFIEKFNQIINDQRPSWAIQIHHVRMIIAGDYHHIDAHIVMPEYWDIKTTHDVIFNYEKQVFEKYGTTGEIHFHVDPCERAYCKNCGDLKCLIRKEAFEVPRKISVKEMLDFDEPAARS
ncbi:cation diffusion facilitator family transporter [bacterium]|nr:cation diffusion facilitator family transporter [bacterium]